MSATHSPHLALTVQAVSPAARERTVVVLCTGAALALGVVAALGPTPWTGFLALMLLIVAGAWTLPPAWVVLVPILATPLQLYLTLPDSSLTVRGTVLFVFAAALRVALTRPDAWRRAYRTWAVPALLFLLAAFIAAVGAPNRYLALKGIYDWLPIFAAVILAAVWGTSAPVRRNLVAAMVGAGVVEAAIGLVEYGLGLDAVLDLLRLPLSQWVFQPSLLSERLSDVSFNWVIFDRAAPFGTFINGIDYAIFLAAILSTIATGEPNDSGAAAATRKRVALYIACAGLLGGALLLTFKGSGMVALGGGLAVVLGLLLLRTRRLALSGRTLALGLAILAGVLVLALPFADLITQRLVFLVQREQGEFGTAGRLEIWVSLLQFLGQRPIFGFGLNNATLLAEPMRTLRGGAVAFNTTTPESAYVAALIETGAVGFLALMALFARTLAHGLRQCRDTQEGSMRIGILAAITAILLGNLTVAGFTTDQNGILLGTLMGMVWAYGIHSN